jgi:hypothetical protein
MAVMTMEQLAALDGAPQVAVKKSKSGGVPEPALTGEQRDAVVKWYKAKIEFDDAEKRVTEQAALIQRWAEPLRLAQCVAKQAATIRLSESVLWQAKNDYRKPPIERDLTPEQLAAVQALGEGYFAVDVQMEFDAAQLTPELLLALKQAGAVSYVKRLKPTARFHSSLHLPAVAAVAANTPGLKCPMFLTTKEAQ